MTSPTLISQAQAWSAFVHTLVNASSRLRSERPALGDSLERRGALACVLYLCASRPRLSVPVAGLPEFRREAVEQLIPAGELLPCASARGSAFVAPAILLEAVLQLPPEWRERLLEGDPAAGIWGEWSARAPAPRPLTEVAVELLAAAPDPEAAARLARRLADVALGVGLEGVAALARGAARVAGSQEAAETASRAS
ncbi:MAG TPA: hypothetical protein VFE30_06255 [Anaeromyxobacteraceae bacterium]|jgi:hypothetical protein|nr:hypothetical protein [Anaeromyxobacteraceae bacterium]